MTDIQMYNSTNSVINLTLSSRVDSLFLSSQAMLDLAEAAVLLTVSGCK